MKISREKSKNGRNRDTPSFLILKLKDQFVFLILKLIDYVIY